MNSIFDLTKNDIQLIDILIEKSYHIRELSRISNVSPAKIHSFTKKLLSKNIISIKKEMNTIKLILNETSFFTKEIKKIIFIEKILNSKNYNRLKKIGKIGVYGSVARGDYTFSSDIDLLIITDKQSLEIRESVNKLQEELKKEINLLILNKEKIKELKTKDIEFYNRLKYESIILDEEESIWI
jgi:predicted nucleotidyltransferase